MSAVKPLLLLLFCLIGYRSAWSQEVLGLDRSSYNTASYYSYSEPGDITIQVNVWGTVRNPGLYEVPEGTRLSELFSLAGGPTLNERRRNEVRNIRVQVTRLQGEGSTGRRIVFDETMTGGVEAFATDPVLQSEDVVSVETVVRAPISWRDASTITSVVTSVAALALQIIALSR